MLLEKVSSCSVGEKESTEITWGVRWLGRVRDALILRLSVPHPECLVWASLPAFLSDLNLPKALSKHLDSWLGLTLGTCSIGLLGALVSTVGLSAHLRPCPSSLSLLFFCLPPVCACHQLCQLPLHAVCPAHYFIAPSADLPPSLSLWWSPSAPVCCL